MKETIVNFICDLFGFIFISAILFVYIVGPILLMIGWR